MAAPDLYTILLVALPLCAAISVTCLTLLHRHRASLKGKFCAPVEQFEEFTRRESHFKAIFDGTLQFMALLDPEGNILEINRAALEFAGVSDESVRGKPFSEAPWWTHSAEEQSRIKRAILQARSGKTVRFETTHISAQGEVIYVDFSLKPVRDTAGQLVFLLPEGRDISDRKRAEDQLRTREITFSAITESAQDAIIMVNSAGAVSFWNSAARRIFGWTEDEAVGRVLYELLNPTWHIEGEDRPLPPLQSISRRYFSGKILSLSVATKREQRLEVELSLSLVYVRNEWQAVGIIRDVTQRKRAEAALKSSEDFLRTVINSTHDAMVVADESGTVTFVNNAAEQIFGCTGDELRSVSVFSNFLGEERAKLQKSAEQALLKGTSGKAEFQAVRKDGARFPVEVSLSRGQGEKGTHILWTVRDITVDKLMEVRERQVRTVEAIGTLAAGIAHEINTPAQYVTDNLTFLKDSYGQALDALDKYSRFGASIMNGETEKVTEIAELGNELDIEFLKSEIPAALSESLSGIGRIAEIVKAMKAFAHPGSNEKKPVDINRAITDTITVARNEWKYVCDVETVFRSGMPLVPCLAGEFNQVILNLIVNAAHAIGEANRNNPSVRGKITVRTDVSDTWAVIEIQDTGTGIPESIRERIFDPFFTTKEVGKGSGQGLSIAQTAIVKKHGGRLTFTSETGKGTTFIIKLPLSSAGAIEKGEGGADAAQA